MSIRYISSDKVISGVPLGGIGCGTLQIFPDGTRGVFTGMNNWENPLGQLHWFRHGSGGDYRVSNPFAIYVEKSERKISKFLQTAPLNDVPTVEKIEFRGAFPKAELSFLDKDLEIEIKLEAFSPFIKGDYKNSALPCAIYRFFLKNPTDTELSVSVLGSAVNPIGRWNVGRFNEVFKNKGLIGINFHKDNCHPNDERDGVITFAVENAGEVSFSGEWNYVGENFNGDQSVRNFQACWQHFSKDGTLPNTNSKAKTMGEGDEWMAGLAIKFTLKPGETRTVNFYYTWFMPNHYLGHMYENWFSDSEELAFYINKNKDRLLDKSMNCQFIIENAPFEEWLKDGLINYLSIITSASWWTKDNKFVMYENPVKWPLMDSLDVRYYGTHALLLYFPELEKNTLRLFKEAQRKDGRITHDLGKSQIDCPSDGTTAGKPWKDLSTKYALMIYRDYLYTKDSRFLKEMYPSVKKAMEWEFSADRDGNFLPDSEGKDQTYDLWDFYGTSSYTSGIFLASLLACIKMADVLKDKKFSNQCKDFFKNGQASFEKELWKDSYYIAGRSKDKVYEACIAGQLNGQWYAHLLDLGYILDEQRTKKAVRMILDLNGKASSFGLVNSVFPDGKIDNSSYHAENIWAGECYAFSSLAIFEGFVEEGLELAKRTWDNFVKKAKNVWYQPDVVFAKDGAMGDGELYVRNLSIWTIPFALARHDIKVKEFLLKLEPKLPL